MISTTLPVMAPAKALDTNVSECSEAAVTYVRMAETLKSDIISEAVRNPYMRSSLIADPVLTVASFVSRNNGADVEVPSDFTVTIIQESSSTVNLVIPAPDNSYGAPSSNVDPISQILNDAAGDPALRRALRDDPYEAFKRELDLRSGGNVKLRDGVVIKLHEPRPGEFVIELPAPIADRSPFMDTMAHAFDLTTFDVVAGTCGNECGYGSQVHTWCNYCGKNTSKTECTTG